MLIRAVLFDFGGTLDGPALHWRTRFAELYQQPPLAVEFERVSAAFGHSTRAAYADRAMPSRRLRATVAFHVERQMEFLGLSDGAAAAAVVDRFVADAEAALQRSRDLLQRLHGKVRLGVISNFYGNVRLLLDDAGITPLLDTIIDSGNVGVSKPDPQIFRLALAELDTDAAEALYVGDTFEKDVLAAHRAGLRTAWLVRDRDQPCPDRSATDFILARLEDVEQVLS